MISKKKFAGVKDSRNSAGPANVSIDQWLASVLRSDLSPCSGTLQAQTDLKTVLERVSCHGVAGLLLDGECISDWPSTLIQEVRKLATSQCMWELRHRAVVSVLLDRFASAGIPVLALKGTALAYDI